MSDYKALPPDQLKFAHYDTGHWPASSVDRAVYRYAAARPNHIFATAHLEGNAFTLPEVRSLLENEIPPGHREEEIQQIIDLDDASTRLIDRGNVPQWEPGVLCGFFVCGVRPGISQKQR